MTKGSTKVAVYARISEDTTREGAGVARQIYEAKQLAEARGWTIVHEFHDNDISASHGAERPGYEALMHAVLNGDSIDHIVVWQTSRLWRNRSERARDIGRLAKAKVGIMAVKGPSLDLTTAYGRGMAGVLGEFDTMESEVKSERVAAKAAERAREGRPNGSIGYGWIQTGRDIVINEDEAHIVRQIIDRLLSGESLHAVTRWLNDSGVVAPWRAMWDRLDEDEQARRIQRGRSVPPIEWGKTSVKKIAVRPSNAALLIRHKGKPDEELLPGAWPALITRDKYEAVRDLLAAPERRRNGIVRPGARRHLLTWGIGECGVCGGRLRVAEKGNRDRGTMSRLYVCDAEGCTGRNQDKVDALVSLYVFERLSRPDALDWLLGDEDAARAANQHLQDLLRRRDEAVDAYADGALTIADLNRIKARLEPQIDEAEAERQRHSRARDLDTLLALAGPKAEDVWDGLSVTQKRTVLEAIGMRVIIDRVKRRGPGFDPESVRVEWRTA